MILSLFGEFLRIYIMKGKFYKEFKYYLVEKKDAEYKAN